ncbi:hypothetical protein HY947_06625 [Candidatus Gottesmanbacteria bacterium]|nr:hypothetical protein [Candidatus Gottesmanbacteria bacterium]
MKDRIYKNFVKRWEEVTDLPPQTLGPFTSSYKDLVHGVKSMPVPVYAVFGLVIAFGMLYFFGARISFFVSLLQKGF